MNNSNLKIENLCVNVGKQEILHKINFQINSGEVHALIGPNGNGKSTLVHALFSHYEYDVPKGDILLDDTSILNKTVDEKSLLGLFLAMQSPTEIPGVLNTDFMREIINVRQDAPLSLLKFYRMMQQNMQKLQMNNELLSRYLNVNFSGGEKKKNEILQMLLLEPKFAFLDEIDSGLDVDALKAIGEVLNHLKNNLKTSFLIISHYDNLFNLIKPDFVHIMLSGNLITVQDKEILKKIQEKGFEFLYRLYNIKKTEREPRLINVTPFAN